MGYSFTPNQRRFIEWLATPEMERFPTTQRALATDMGVHYQTLTKWHAKPEIKAEVKAIIMENLDDALVDVVYSFKAEAKKGSYQHQKTYFEMLGMYVPKQQQEQSGEIVLRVVYDTSNSANATDAGDTPTDPA